MLFRFGCFIEGLNLSIRGSLLNTCYCPVFNPPGVRSKKSPWKAHQKIAGKALGPPLR